MRPFDLAAIGLTLAACLLVVQATYNPPVVAPGEVGAHVGERVRVEGMVIELRRFDEVSRFVLVADGAAVHARAEGTDLVEDTWVSVTATVDREGGRPLLRVEAIRAGPADADKRVDLVAIGLDPARHADRLITVQGYLERGRLQDNGVALQTTAHGLGPVALDGVLRYDARCLCYVFHADAWTP